MWVFRFVPSLGLLWAFIGGRTQCIPQSEEVSQPARTLGVLPDSPGGEEHLSREFNGVIYKHKVIFVQLQYAMSLVRMETPNKLTYRNFVKFESLPQVVHHLREILKLTATSPQVFKSATNTPKSVFMWGCSPPLSPHLVQAFVYFMISSVAMCMSHLYIKITY